MPDAAYHQLMEHRAALQQLLDRYEPDEPGRDRIEARVNEAKRCVREHIRAVVARRSPQ